jgi:hypothetical protein
MHSARNIACLATAAIGLLSLGGCGPDVADMIAALVAKEAGIEAKVTELSQSLKSGEPPSTEAMAQEQTRLAEARAEVSDLTNGGGLTTEQSQQTSAMSTAIENTKGELDAEQSIATDANSVAQSSTGQDESVASKFLQRAQKIICHKIRQAQAKRAGSQPEPAQAEPTVPGEEAEVESELGSEAETPSSVAHVIVGETLAIANREIGTINNVIEMNPAGIDTILQAAYDHFSC